MPILKNIKCLINLFILIGLRPFGTAFLYAGYDKVQGF
jgi:hypothetical protein